MNIGAIITATVSSVNIRNFYYNGTAQTAASSMTVYYR